MPRPRLGRLATILLLPLAAACSDDDTGPTPPPDNTVTLSAAVSADLGEKVLFLLSSVPGFEPLAAFSSFGALFLSLTGNRVSSVQVNTNLTGAAAAQGYEAAAVLLVYQNPPAGVSAPPGGVVTFHTATSGQPYTDFAYAFATAGSGAIAAAGTGGLAIVSGTKANGYAGTQRWVATAGSVSLGSGTGSDVCPNSQLLAIAAPGVTCTTQFFQGSFTISSATPVDPATGTKQASLATSRIIGVRLTIDCNVSTLC